MEQLATAKELQRRSVLPFSAGSGEGAQDSCRRAQAMPSPGVLTVLFFLALVSCCTGCSAIWTAATSIAGQSCPAEEVESLLFRRANQTMAGHSDLGAPVATFPWEVHSSADRGCQGGGEESPGEHRPYVAPCLRGLREDRGCKSPQGIHQRNHFSSPDKAAHRVCPARAKPSFSSSADEIARSLDLFSAIRRVVFPDQKQMDIETPQCKRPPDSEPEISDVDHVDTETEAEQMERLMQIQGENSKLVSFRKKAPKKPKS